MEGVCIQMGQQFQLQLQVQLIHFAQLEKKKKVQITIERRRYIRVE
jgi:hypothetical protein